MAYAKIHPGAGNKPKNKDNDEDDWAFAKVNRTNRDESGIHDLEDQDNDDYKPRNFDLSGNNNGMPGDFSWQKVDKN